jgi:hypothetical protein
MPEYQDMGDLDFAQRMLRRAKSMATASEQERDKFFTLFTQRLPQYRNYTRMELQAELVRLFTQAVAHFS